MQRETFFDRWSPEAPVKVTWASDEPDAYLSLADAGYRLARLFPVAYTPDGARKELLAGRRFVTDFAIYQLVTAVTA